MTRSATFDWQCRPAQAEQLGQLAVAWITQYLVGPPDNHWGFFRFDTESAEQGFGGLVLFEVNESVRQAITGRELTKPAGVRG